MKEFREERVREEEPKLDFGWFFGWFCGVQVVVVVVVVGEFGKGATGKLTDREGPKLVFEGPKLGLGCFCEAVKLLEGFHAVVVVVLEFEEESTGKLTDRVPEKLKPLVGAGASAFLEKLKEGLEVGGVGGVGVWDCGRVKEEVSEGVCVGASGCELPKLNFLGGVGAVETDEEKLKEGLEAGGVGAWGCELPKLNFLDGVGAAETDEEKLKEGLGLAVVVLGVGVVVVVVVVVFAEAVDAVRKGFGAGGTKLLEPKIVVVVVVV